jgi:hypothetical protein
VTKTVTPPPVQKKTAAAPLAEPPSFLDRVLIFLHLKEPPLKAVTTVVKKAAGPPATPTKTAVAPPAQTKGTARGGKTAVPPATKAAATGTKTVATAPPQTTPAPSSKTVTPPPTKTATAPQQTKTAAGTKVTPPGAAAGTPAAAGASPRLKGVTSDTALAKPLVIMREVYTYDAAGRRDPFLSLLTTTDLRPTLSDLKIIATVVDEPGRSVALLQDKNAGKQVSVRVGTKLGRMRVASIRPNVVVFTIDEFGTTRLDSLQLRDLTKVRGR